MSERLRKINDLLRDEVGKILHDEFRLADDILITVMGATVSPTLEHATIMISVLPENNAKNILKIINSRIYNIQKRLNKRLVMRPVPKIRFEIDTTEASAQHIEELLQKVKEK